MVMLFSFEQATPLNLTIPFAWLTSTSQVKVMLVDVTLTAWKLLRDMVGAARIGLTTFQVNDVMDTNHATTEMHGYSILSIACLAHVQYNANENYRAAII